MPRYFLAVALPLALAACWNPFSSDRAVTLPVQDVAMPQELARDAELTVTLNVVTGGCRYFERIDARRSAESLTLVARGRDASGPGVMCTTDIRYEEQVYRAGPVSGDSLTVVVRQPRGDDLVRRVRVRR